MSQKRELGFLPILLRCIVVAILCLGAGPGQADEGATASRGREPQQSLEEFVTGNVQFILMHELAHLIISEKQVPVLGPEEQAADSIAATFLLRGDGQDAAVRQRLRGHVESAARAFAILWEHEQRMGSAVPYWSSHALGIQRYYRLMCLLAGSDPEFVRSSAAFGEIDAQTTRDCDIEYAKADRAIQWLVDNYGRRPEDPPSEAVDIVYEPPGSRTQEKLVNSIRERQILELTLAALNERFVIQRPLRLEMRVCRRPAAIWNPDDGVLTICYELLEAFRQIYLIGRRQG